MSDRCPLGYLFMTEALQSTHSLCLYWELAKIIIYLSLNAYPQLGHWLVNESQRGKNPTLLILTRSDLNQAVQPLEMARSLKFWIKEAEVLYYPSSDNKGADQLCSYCEADLHLCFRICKTLVFSQQLLKCFHHGIFLPPIRGIYSQEPKVFPQCWNFHRFQCMFMVTRKFNMLLLANTF